MCFTVFSEKVDGCLCKKNTLVCVCTWKNPGGTGIPSPGGRFPLAGLGTAVALWKESLQEKLKLKFELGKKRKKIYTVFLILPIQANQNVASFSLTLELQRIKKVKEFKGEGDAGVSKSAFASKGLNNEKETDCLELCDIRRKRIS